MGMLLLVPWMANAQTNEQLIRVRLYANVYPGKKDDKNKVALYSLTDHVTEELEKKGIRLKRFRVGEGVHAFECDVEHGKTLDDLWSFGKKLDSGKYHLGIVWGLEYGWMKQREEFKYLEVLAVCRSIPGLETRSTLLARKTGAELTLSTLKEKRLARYSSEPLMHRILLNQIIKENRLDKDVFTSESESPYLNMERALRAVVFDGKADCVMVNNANWAALQVSNPPLANKFAPVDVGKGVKLVFPSAVIIGRPSNLRTGLWTSFQNELSSLKGEGKELVKYWQLDRFDKPDKRELDEIREFAKKYPVESLYKQ
jgi:hypothetical protein